MNPSQTDALRFAQNLPFYANGSLPANEQAWMEAYLAQHPQWQTDVEQARHERIASQSLRSDVPESMRLTVLKRQLAWPDAVVQAQPATHQNPRTVLTHPWLTGLLGMLLGGLLVTGAGIFMPHADPLPIALQSTAMSRGERRDCPTPQDIRISVSASMQWGELAQLLRKLQLQLVSGPDQDGEVWVRINQGASMTETLSLLRNSPAIEQALPARTSALPQPCTP